MPDEALERIFQKIDRQELIELAVKLAGTYSPPGLEKDAGDVVFEWLAKEGFGPERLGLVPERFSVVARIKGTGGGYSMLFNSHLDQAVAEEDWLVHVNPRDPIYTNSWVEGDSIYGYGAVNDKGPMATFLIAAKAIRDSGVRLKGDLVLTAVPGEIGQEPVDEFQGSFYQGKDIGARYMVNHGGVADYAVVAECTGFSPIWVEAGKAFFKITIFGEPSIYAPFVERPTTLEKSPNAIPRTAKVIEAFEEWAYNYEKRKTREYTSGTVIPKANICAIRGGLPYKLAHTTEVCIIYADVRLLPEETPLEAERELSQMLTGLGIPFDIKLTLYRRGYEAKNIDRPLKAILASHRAILGREPKRPIPPYSSMWRDVNVFNEMGIPSLTYGPLSVRKPYHVKIDDFVAASKIYASTAFDLCNQQKAE